jgi:hypothetical protein
VTEHTRNQIFLRNIQKIFFKIFTLVLSDRFLDGFSKFWFFIGEIFILIFESFSKIIACVCWAYAETILSHAEHTRNRFHSMLSIRGGTNFRACSVSGKMWTFLYVQSMLSIRGTNFIALWAYGELISSHAEHTGNRFSSHAKHARCLKVEYLGRIQYDLQKSCVTGPWDHKVSVSAKKVLKHFMLVYL